MHEVGILMEALQIALDAAEPEGAKRITKMRVKIGALAGVVPDAMAFAFEVASAGTIAEHGQFEWEVIPVRCRCASGCPDFEPDSSVYRCPNCGALSTELLSGRELQLCDIEIEI